MSGQDVSPNLVDCLTSLMETATHSDIKIRVIPLDKTETERSFFAHRCILACRTKIPAAETAIIIKDVSPKVFGNLLKFVYTDVAVVSTESVYPMLHLARLYEVPGLEIECFNYLINRLCAQNVFRALEEANASDRRDVISLCRKVIEQNPDIIQPSSLSTLKASTLSDVLSDNNLPAEESVIFNSVMAWSRAQCEENGQDISPGNQRKALGEILFKVRFIWLPEEFLYSTVLKSGVLTSNEIAELWQVKTTGKFPSSLFEVPRRGSPVLEPEENKRLCRFMEIRNYMDSGQWECDGSSDAITLTVNRSVWLVGVTLYGPRETHVGLYKVWLEVHHLTRCLSRIKTEILMKKSVVTFKVEFPEAIHLRGDLKYDICLRLLGPATYYGALQNPDRFAQSAVDGCPSFDQPDLPVFMQDGITFTFGNSLRGTTEGSDSIHGQIPEIIYRVAEPGEIVAEDGPQAAGNDPNVNSVKDEKYIDNTPSKAQYSRCRSEP